MSMIEQREKARAREAELLHSILTLGGVEELVHSGRLPRFLERDPLGKKDIICLIPPEGATLKDEVRYAPGLGGVWGVYSPKGEYRGTTAIISTSPVQTKILQERIDSTLKEMKKGRIQRGFRRLLRR